MIATSMLALFTLNSCLQVESTISLKKDGSGTITEELILGEQMVQMMQMAKAQAAQAGGEVKDPMAEMLDPKKAKERAKTMGEGVEFVSIKKIDENGKLGVRTIYKFSDINKLSYDSSGAMNMGDEGPKGKKDAKDKPMFKFADGKLTIIQNIPKGKKGKNEAKEEEPEIDEQSLAMMKGMMKDMKMTLKIKFESGIAKTNATYVDGDTVTLAEIDFGKLVSDPKKLKSVMSGDFEKNRAALKGVEGIKFEDKDVVEVKMK